MFNLTIKQADKAVVTFPVSADWAKDDIESALRIVFPTTLGTVTKVNGSPACEGYMEVRLAIFHGPTMIAIVDILKKHLKKVSWGPRCKAGIGKLIDELASIP